MIPQITLILLASSGPYIAHITDTAPRQTMVVSGGGYNPQTVRVVLHVPGNLTSERNEVPPAVRAMAASYSGASRELPDRPPTERTHTLKTLHVSPRSVFAAIPSHRYPPGYTAIAWLKDGDRWSNPFVVNRPRGWFLLKTRSRPGEMNRLCGLNLRADRYVPRYLFLRPKGGKPVELQEVARHKEDGVSEQFCAQFRLPVDLSPGEYEVFLHNNSGGAYGFTRPLPLTVTTGRLGGNPVSFWASENCTFEHNRAYNSNRGFVWQVHGNFGHYHNFIAANVVEDARFGGNAGETYLFEGSGFKWFGQPSSVTADGFAVDGAAWQPDGFREYFAVVTAGRGLGQYRRIASNTTNSVRLAEPWLVLPSGDLRVSILRGVVENAICNNRHVDCDNSMMFYGSGTFVTGTRIEP